MYKENNMFKVGDKVKRTKGDALVIGRVYEVVSVSKTGSYISVKGENGLWYSEHFELVIPHTSVKPHKHCDLIKAWADGAEIEYYSSSQDKWIICLNNLPQWHEDMAYRLKPTPKPDVVKWGNINVRKDIYNSLNLRVNEVDQTDANVKLVFDGETEELKEAIIL
jgi:hypothetical protein